MKKILYGVCGIGRGHTQRQLPLLEHYAASARIVVFAYGESLAVYTSHFRTAKNVTVVPVAVPFFAGNRTGLDFAETARRNAGKDFFAVNAAALAEAERLIGVPNLVLSDYEPVCAQYAYATGAPFVTIDQQSKYLRGAFPSPLGGQTYADEIARLRLFFPTASTRIACSFFRIAKKPGGENVHIVPPVLDARILSLRRRPSKERSLLLYLSSQQEFPQSFDEVLRVCAARKDTRFHLFARDLPARALPPNVMPYAHGDRRFHDVLAACRGIVATAGHGLLSEAMHLGIPVYALPLPVYEQQMNAHVVDANGFGIAARRFTSPKLAAFLAGIPRFADAISRDRRALLRGSGKKRILDILDAWV